MISRLLPCLALVATTAQAGDYEDGEALAAAKAGFDGALKSMNEKCGTKITATYDLSTEKYQRERFDEPNKKWFLEPNRDEGQFKLEKGFGYELCACALKGIENSCDKDTFKAFIAAKLKSVQ